VKPQEEGLTGLRFHVRYGDGRVEQLVVDAERALIGSAAHCEVRLPTESAAPEHVEVFASDGRVHLTARPNERPPVLDGVPCLTGPWQKGRVLTIGAATLTVESVELGQKVKTRSPFWLLAPVPFIVLAVTFFFATAAAGAPPAVPDAPKLFDAPLTTCPTAAGPDQLRALAGEKLRLGSAKRERSPFSVHDGVEAVPLFESAAACYRVARLPDVERSATGSATALRQKLEEEYRVRRVRLEHAYRLNDLVAAKRELNVLIPMLSHRPGPFLDWMKWLDRAAAVEIDRRARTL
jgi:hypothetical protein